MRVVVCQEQITWNGGIILALLLTICVAILGGCIGLKLRIPAGAMIGAMIATAMLHVAFEAAYMPPGLKFYTQVATGAYIGAKISMDDVRELKRILKAAAVLVAIMLAYAVGVGLLLYRISDLSVATALFAMAPGGITDMTLISMDFDAESSVVALIQTLRLVATICVLPTLIKRVCRGRPAAEATAREKAGRPKKAQAQRTLGNLVLTLLTGLICGGIGKLLSIPGGTIAFSMAGCVAFHVLTGRGYMPLNLRRFIQMFAGALIGCTIGRTQLLQMTELWAVVIIAVVSFILLDLVAAAAIHRLTGMDMITALFSSAPGGLTDMVLIAEDMGADSLKIAGMHTVRLMSVVALYPAIIHLALTLPWL